MSPPEIANAARALVAAAFEVLTEARVIPTSRYHPFVQAGRDYEGRGVIALPEFTALERLLTAAYPGRFAGQPGQKNPEFTHTYLLNFIEACVRRCADEDRYVADAAGVTASIDELIDLLDASSHAMAAVRAMSHVATVGSTALVLDGIEIQPEPGRTNREFFLDSCRSKIPGAGGSFNRDIPFVFARPHAVLSTQEATEGSDAFAAADRASRRINQFVLAVRLLTGATARAHFEVQGPTTLVGAIHPQLIRYRGSEEMPMVRRIAVLQADLERPIREIGLLLDNVEIKRANMVAASFDVARSRFTASFADDRILALVDLATALEAVFIDEKDGTGGVTGRLRNRAAALLTTDDDPPANIFNDVNALYSLRSTLVHGGNLTETRLRSKVLGISTISEREKFGISTMQAVDRMRDLVRRAILARLCLAAGSEPLWPFNPTESIEVAFADDDRRREMRDYWHAALDKIGARSSADHLPAPGDIISEDYGSTAQPE